MRKNGSNWNGLSPKALCWQYERILWTTVAGIPGWVMGKRVHMEDPLYGVGDLVHGVILHSDTTKQRFDIPGRSGEHAGRHNSHVVILHQYYTRLNLGIADQQNAGIQGRDGSIKQFGIQLHPTYFF